jgi:hypothetical protein
MSPMAGNPPWAPEEDQRLRALALSGASVAEMAIGTRSAKAPQAASTDLVKKVHPLSGKRLASISLGD